MIWDGEQSPLIEADKVEQHIHTFPPEKELLWRGLLTGFGLTCGVGCAIAGGKLIDAIVKLIGLVL